MKYTGTWIAWLLMTLSLILSTRNPLYLLIIMVCSLLLGIKLAQNKGQTYWLKQNFRFLLTMIGISSVINTLFNHTGQSIIFTIPQNWSLIGGNITWESLLYGVINGMIIGSLYLAFNIINLALSIKQLTQLIPRGLRPIAMIVTITLTFFPSIQERAREIKEAQQIRGNQMKRIRDWLPLFLPLLITSLEDAISLSESMTSRCFQSQPEKEKTSFILISLVISTFAIFSGWVLNLYNYPEYWIITLYLIGSTGVISILLVTNKQVKVTRYHKEKPSMLDFLLISIFIISLIIFFSFRQSENLISIAYTPYTFISMPEITWLGCLLTLVPILPTFFLKK